jgi:hypothetical protein
MLVTIKLTIEKTVDLDDEDDLTDRMAAVNGQLMEDAEDLSASGWTDILYSSARIQRTAKPSVEKDEEDEESDTEEIEDEAADSEG